MTEPTTEIPSAPAPRTGKGALRVLAVLAVVLAAGAVVGYLLYAHKQPRMQVNEGPAMVAKIMESEADFYRDHGRFPEANEQDDSLLGDEPHVASVNFRTAGVLVITYQGRHEIDGKTLTLTPYVDNDGKLQWRCDLPDIPPAWWPDLCRTQTTP